MDGYGVLIVAVVVVVAIAIALAARRWRGDRPTDRGPYSTAMETRGSLAAMGATLPEPRRDAPEDRPEPDD